jgi:hypothetical protein
MPLKPRSLRSHPPPNPMAGHGSKVCDPLHLVDQLFFVFVPANPNSHNTQPPFQLHLNNLKTSARLNSPLAANVHPIDVVEWCHLLLESSPEDDVVFGDDEPPVANPIRDQRNEGNENKQYNNIENGITEDECKRVLNKIPSDPSIQNQREKIDQRLLVIEIKFILEDLPMFFHTFTQSLSQGEAQPLRLSSLLLASQEIKTA